MKHYTPVFSQIVGTIQNNWKHWFYSVTRMEFLTQVHYSSEQRGSFMWKYGRIWIEYNELACQIWKTIVKCIFYRHVFPHLRILHSFFYSFKLNSMRNMEKLNILVQPILCKRPSPSIDHSVNKGKGVNLQWFIGTNHSLNNDDDDENITCWLSLD